MNCPACSHVLQPMTFSGITLDVCQGGCGGIWFDQFELQKVDEPHESAGEAVLNVQRDPAVTVDHSKRRNCPRCPSRVMMRHFFSPKREVEVDECPECGGFWLDHGELGKIRNEYKTDAERSKAASAYFTELFGGELAAMRAHSQLKKEKAQSIAKMFRFICPSYYVPGKQPWGAF